MIKAENDASNGNELDTAAPKDSVFRRPIHAFKPESKRRGIEHSQPNELSLQPLSTAPFSPILVESKEEGRQVDIMDWLDHSRSMIDNSLSQAGAILFRGFELGTVERVTQFSNKAISSIFTENTEHRPADRKGAVQYPVEYAKDQFLLWHNENSFNLNWPKRAIFACAEPARMGGETPLVDSRLIYQQLDSELRAEFMEKQVMYVRNYGPNNHVGLGWPTIFNTKCKEQVEKACHDQEMELEWLPGERLLTRAIRPAAIQHPVTGEWSWFNQAQHWHVSCISKSTRSAFELLYRDEKDYPRNCFFGDGSRIPDSTMQAILNLYQDNHFEFVWQKGDLLLVDNILKAHARNPFHGERKILVCFGDLGSFRN